MKTKYNYIEPLDFGADLETDHDPECTHAWICQWAVSKGDWSDQHDCPMGWTGADLDDLEHTLKVLMDKYKHIRIWFHNFTYDDSYLHAMYKKWEAEIENGGFTMEGKDNPSYIVNNGRPVIVRFQFDKDHSITFCDSLRKMNNSLAEIAEMMGMEKLVAPAEKFYPGWSKDRVNYRNMIWYEPSWQYVVNDAYIVAKFIQKEVNELHQKGYTYSSDAFKEGKKMVGTGNYKGWESKWDRCMPSLIVDAKENLDRELLVDDETLREGYFGGVNMSQFKDQGLLFSKPGKKIYHIDYNSMYPSQMVHRPLPYGYCFKVTHDEFPENAPDFLKDSMCYVATLRAKLHLKEGKLPWFAPKTAHSLDDEDAKNDPNWNYGKHVIDTDVWHWLTLTDIDLGTLRMCYDVEIDYDYEPNFYWFNTQVGLLKPYIDKYYNLKSEEKAKGPDRDELFYAHYKVMMNSFYGRTGMNPHRERVTLADENEDYRWMKEKYYEPDIETYIPYAMFITAWARRQLVTGWEAVGMENVIHSDTDSIIFFGDKLPEGLKISNLGLDCWGNECPAKDDYGGTSIVAYYEGGLKRYAEFYAWPPQRVKDVKITCAGVPNHKYRHARLDEAGNPVQKDGKTIYDEYPNQMGVELYDNPALIQMDGYELGHEHYQVQSEWLRKEIAANNGDPDDMDTNKLMPKLVPGGKILMPSTYVISDNMRVIYR